MRFCACFVSSPTNDEREKFHRIVLFSNFENMTSIESDEIGCDSFEKLLSVLFIEGNNLFEILP